MHTRHIGGDVSLPFAFLHAHTGDTANRQENHPKKMKKYFFAVK